MKKLFPQIIAGLLSIFIAQKVVPGVSLTIIPGQTSIFGVQFTAEWQILLLIGVFFGLINFLIKPILNLITWPLKLLTFGLFGLLVNMALVELVDVLFPELVIQGIIPLFWTTIIIWGISLILVKIET